MKKILPLILCLSLVLSLLAGCVPEDRAYEPTGDALAEEDADLWATEPTGAGPTQELTLIYYPDRSLNPFTCADFTNQVILSLMYQGLFNAGRNGEVYPILCESYECSANYKTYTFYLDSNAKFSDGSRVTLDDVQASFQAAKDSSYFGGRFLHINSFAVNGEGFTVQLDTPMEDFLLLMDIPIVKASQVEAESPVGSGPYVLGQGLSGPYLRRNLDWWCSSPDLAATADSIPLVVAENNIQIRDQFQFGEVGLVCTNPCSDSYADYRCDYELWEVDTGIMVYIGCNVAYSDIFANPTMRAAMTYGIDREFLVSEHYNNFAEAATLPMSPSSPYYSKSLASKYAYDPVQFISTVSKAGVPGAQVELLVNSDDSLRLRVARVIANSLTDLGLDTVTVEKPTREYTALLKAGNYDIYLGETRLSSTMDLTPFLRTWGNLTWGGIADPNLYTLCQGALENSGNFHDLHKALADDGRIVPVVFLNYAVYATRGLLTTLQPSRGSIFCYSLGRTEADALIPIDYGIG